MGHDPAMHAANTPPRPRPARSTGARSTFAAPLALPCITLLHLRTVAGLQHQTERGGRARSAADCICNWPRVVVLYSAQRTRTDSLTDSGLDAGASGLGNLT